MKIWIDADACPGPIREIVFRASRRLSIEVVLVANSPSRTPKSALVSYVVVPKGLDEADMWIADRVEVEDLVITADIPFAAAVVEKGAIAINPRGEAYTEDNVRARLSMRDFMTELRESGVQTGGAAPFGPKDKQRFANSLDRILAQRKS